MTKLQARQRKEQEAWEMYVSLTRDNVRLAILERMPNATEADIKSCMKAYYIAIMPLPEDKDARIQVLLKAVFQEA